jgi:hypothetical protein
VLLVVTLFAATLITSLGLTIAWQQQHKITGVVPADVSVTATQPASATPDGQSNDKPSSPIPAPPAVSTATTTPAVSVPPDAETTPVRTAVVSAPPPRREPNPPVFEPVPPPPPVSEPPAPRTRSSAPSDSSTPRTTRVQAPPGIVGIPTGDPDPPKRTATRRSTGEPSRG